MKSGKVKEFCFPSIFDLSVSCWFLSVKQTASLYRIEMESARYWRGKSWYELVFFLFIIYTTLHKSAFLFSEFSGARFLSAKRISNSPNIGVELMADQKTSVVIADDHRVVMKGIRHILKEYPEFILIGEALNGRDAVKMVNELSPDVVILDISMPDLNGLDATLQIKKKRPDTRIVVYTMVSNRDMVLEMFKAGISAYVLKEDPLSELVLALQAVRRNGTYFSSLLPDVLLNHLKALEEGQDVKSRFETLSLREREVFQLLAEGKRIKQIADILCISHKTVEAHKYNIFDKLNIKSTTDLILLAIRKNIIPLK